MRATAAPSGDAAEQIDGEQDEDDDYEDRDYGHVILLSILGVGFRGTLALGALGALIARVLDVGVQAVGVGLMRGGDVPLLGGGAGALLGLGGLTARASRLLLGGRGLLVGGKPA